MLLPPAGGDAGALSARQERGGRQRFAASGRQEGVDDDAPVDPNARSPQLGRKYKDLDLLGELLGRGVDRSRPRGVVFHCHAPNREDAESMARVTVDEGFESDVRDPQPAAPGRWRSWPAAGRSSHRASSGVVDCFDDLADRHAAEFDGWEVAVRR